MQRLNTINEVTKDDIALLSRYDESSAKEIDELKAESEALQSKKTQLLEEIERAKKQLALADKKSMLNEIYKEQDRLQSAISDIRQTLPKLQTKVDSFKFDFDVTSLQERYQKTINEINDTLAQKESYKAKLLVLKDEIQSLSNLLKDSQTAVLSLDKEITDLNHKAETLKNRLEGLKRLKNSLCQKTDTLQNPYKDAIDALKTDIRGLSELCQRLTADYGSLLGSAQGLLGFIIEKSQLSIKLKDQSEEINNLNSQTERLQAETERITVLIDEVVKQTLADKQKSQAIQSELDNIEGQLQKYLAEIAKVKELTKDKDNVEESFKRLFIENACLSEGIKTALRAHRRIKDIVRKLL